MRKKIKIELDIEIGKEGLLCSPRLSPIIWGCKVSNRDLLRYSKGKLIKDKHYIPFTSIRERHKALLEKKEELEKTISILNNILNKIRYRRNKK